MDVRSNIAAKAVEFLSVLNEAVIVKIREKVTHKK